MEELAGACLYECASNSKECIEACQNDTSCISECYRLDVQCHDGKLPKIIIDNLSAISQNKKLKIVRADQIALMVVTNAAVLSVNVKKKIRMLNGMNA